MCTILKERLFELVKKIESRSPYYVEIEEWLDEMVDIMLENEGNTIGFFTNTNPSHSRIIYWISPLLQDIAYRFSSDVMASAMASLIDKYPEDLGLKSDVELSLNIIHNVQNDPSLT